MIPISTSSHAESARKAVALLLAALAAGAITFCIYYLAATHPIALMMNKPASDMDWLRTEFNLSDDQFAKIKALHIAYQPKCGLMCQHIAEADGNLEQLITANQTVTPELEAALKRCAVVEEECHHAMLEHIYAVSAEMSPVSRDRYLQMMKKWMVQPRLGVNTAVTQPPKD